VIHDNRIKEMEGDDVVGLELTTSAESIAYDASAALDRIYDGLKANSIFVAGPSRLVYHEMHIDSWRIELCVPVLGDSNPPDGFHGAASKEAARLPRSTSGPTTS
jgi:hypothetical protein